MSNISNERRKFLKIAALAAVLGVGGVATSKLSAYMPERERFEESSKAFKGKRWGLVIDTRKFKTEEDFKKVIETCHHLHNVPDIPDKKQEIKWIWEDEFEHVFPSQINPFLTEKLKDRKFLVLCNHCDNPPCVRVCPTQATFKRDDGIVMMDFHRCIGCRYCMAACPYGSRSFNFRDPAPYVKDKNPEFPTRMRGVVEKCLLCYERLEKGQKPACVEASNGAIIFGDLSDPNSEIRKVLRENYTIRRKVELGTNPCVFYII